MAEVHGTYTDQFVRVREALALLLETEDVGASVAVYVDGEPVVDIWGGYADAERTIPWQRDTLVNVWSTTKPMAALCALILADRGELDLTAPVARYWPEFAAAGKQNVQVRHVLAHTAGLPTWDEPMTVEDLYDWHKATERLATQAPHWEPGTDAGYHAVTQGYLIGEVVRRITGRSLGAFFAEEVAAPLDADFHIGLDGAHDHRVAPVLAPPSADPATDPATDPVADRLGNQPPAGTATRRSAGAGTAGPQSAGASVAGPRSASAGMAGPRSADARSANPVLGPADANTTAWRRAEIPAANGHGNARSVCAIQSVLACGGAARGVRLLSRAGCEQAMAEQFRGVDRILGTPMRYGMGYGLGGGMPSRARTCFWGGAGGSMVWVDLDARMAVSYVMNQMRNRDGDDRAMNILLATYTALSATPTG